MAESARTRQMYSGELNPDEGDNMPRSLQEDYNASRSGEAVKIGDETGIEYDGEQMAEAIQAYQNFDAEPEYGEDALLENEDAIDAFGELWSES